MTGRAYSEKKRQKYKKKVIIILLILLFLYRERNIWASSYFSLFLFLSFFLGFSSSCVHTSLVVVFADNQRRTVHLKNPINSPSPPPPLGIMYSPRFIAPQQHRIPRTSAGPTITLRIRIVDKGLFKKFNFPRKLNGMLHIC